MSNNDVFPYKSGVIFKVKSGCGKIKPEKFFKIAKKIMEKTRKRLKFTDCAY